DVLISSPTGSGKTLAYIIPIISKLTGFKIRRLRALIVVPTKDLVYQVKTVFSNFANDKLKIGIAVGDVPFQKEQKNIVSTTETLIEGGLSEIDILICTPGRLADHIRQTPNFTLQHLEFIVIDEADRLLNQNYQDWLLLVLDCVEKPFKHETSGLKGSISYFQVENNEEMKEFFEFQDWKVNLPRKLLFSATITHNPEKVDMLHLRDPVFIQTTTNSESEKHSLPTTLKEFMCVVFGHEKPKALLYLLGVQKETRCLCFTNSKESTENLVRFLQFFDFIKVASFTSDRSFKERKKILDDFKFGEIDILVCSDSIARGVDLDDINCVINYDCPSNFKTYVHRSGRTARAGKHGKSISIIASHEVMHFR
ncbi:DEAD-domain-containing protein, partial [Rozella allomycis CSF55]